MPIILYNNPGTKGNIPFSLVKLLSIDDNIAGIIDSSGDPSYFNQLLNIQNDNFKVFQASERLFYESFNEIEPAGIASSFANAAPAFIREYYMVLQDFNMDMKLATDESIQLFYQQPVEAYQRKLDHACQLIYGKDYMGKVRGLKTWLKEQGIISTDVMAGASSPRISQKDIRKAEKLIV